MPPSSTDPRAAAARGVAFLLARQDADGGWRDFDLPPGRADAWSTAYVVLALAAAAETSGRRAARRGADLLGRLRRVGGGWGYNAGCPVDADSTALACLALEAVADAPQPRDLAALARFQHADGGFATYAFGPPDHGWRQPHPEVTATALRALAPRLGPEHERIRRGLEWLRRKAAAGRLKSYWWAADAYLDLELARLARALCVGDLARGSFAPQAVAPTSAFDLALRLARTAEPELARDLCRRQLPDGGWPAAPILRLTDPWNDTAGRLYADIRRCFVTAAAVSALRGSRSLHPSREPAPDGAVERA